MDIQVQRKNAAYIKIKADPGPMRELWEHFTFTVPGYQFMPAYKRGTWDGKIRLLNPRTGEVYSGLADKVKEWTEVSEYNFIPESTSFENAPTELDDIDFDEFGQFLVDLNLHSGGERITPYDYQLKAIYEALTNKQRLLISPTASGKSLIIYIILRWLQRHSDERIAIVVPTTALVKQMIGDFADYSQYDDSWNVKDHCHGVMSGTQKVTKHQITVTTWQSFAKFPTKSYKEYGAIIGDEAHTFTAKSLTTIMEKLVNAYYRIGTTGTLKDSKVHSMVLEGLFGRIVRVTDTRTMIDQGRASELDIKVCRLRYSKNTKSILMKDPKNAGRKKPSYESEIRFINSHEWRNNFIANLALNLDGNTIVLYKNLDHGKDIYDKIMAKAHEKRKVFLINGKTDTEDRDAVRAIVEKEKNAIIVASLGTFSTGVNIKNIHNIIFGSPTKSFIKVMQSIGRGLRKATDGIGCVFIDIVYDMSTSKWDNFTLKHGADRLKMYIAEKFDYEMQTIEVPNE